MARVSIHLNAPEGQIAPTVLLPGDPLRAQHIAQTFFENPVQHNSVRGMLGFTGTYKGKPVSVQGTGMGIPSVSIYATELMKDYGCTTLVRVGTCGSFQERVRVRDVVLAQASSTDSSLNKMRFSGRDFAPVADFGLLMRAYQAAVAHGLTPHVGNVLSSDNFYNDDPEEFRIWPRFGVLAVEMEAAGLYTLAAKYGARALTVLTVSDHLITHEVTTAEERQTTFNAMIEVALEAALADQ